MEDAATIYFPAIHSEHNGELIRLVCFAGSHQRSLVQALSGIDNDTAANIIGASRFGENSPLASQPIMINVSNPQFSGRSYALALALADKILRHGARQPNGARVIATGRVEPDGCGAVSAIEGINDKLRLVLEHLHPNDIILFPAENLDPSAAEQRKLLKAITAKGAQWQTLSHINETENILWGQTIPPAAEKTSPTPWPKQRIAMASTALGLITLAAIALMLWQSPGNAHRPESIVQAKNDSLEKARQTPPVKVAALDAIQPRITPVSTAPTPAQQPATERHEPKEEQKIKPEFIIPPVFIPTDHF